MLPLQFFSETLGFSLFDVPMLVFLRLLDVRLRENLGVENLVMTEIADTHELLSIVRVPTTVSQTITARAPSAERTEGIERASQKQLIEVAEWSVCDSSHQLEEEENKPNCFAQSLQLFPVFFISSGHSLVKFMCGCSILLQYLDQPSQQ